MLFSICFVVFASSPALAQSEPRAAPACAPGQEARDGECATPEGRCYPWQEYRDGHCIVISSAAPAAPALAVPVPAVQCSGGITDADGQCTCPTGMHLDTGRCAADVKPPTKAEDKMICDGGTAANGRCNCPAGFNLLPDRQNNAGGTCVRVNAENCRGGDLTVAGTCLCNGRVTMSGETYALELLGSQCVPKICPLYSYLKDGKCVASGDKEFGFTCRTGYIPDEANPGTLASGLHCVPDPSFCPPDLRRKSGACAKPSAIAINCFEDRCVCGDPHADWINYLCQCRETYRNVNGSCISGAADSSKPGVVERTRSEPADEPAHRRSCGRGMIRTRHGCVAARRRYPVDIGPYYQGERTYPVPDYGPARQN
jgi:hypothetical protein